MFPYLALSALTVFFIPRKAKSVVAAVAIILGAALAAVAAIETLTQGASTLIEGIDGLSSIFVIAVAISCSAASIYAIGYMKSHSQGKSNSQLSLHFAALVLLFYSMISVLSATDNYQFLLWWELMTLSSFVLVIFEASRKEVLHAGISYLILMHVGFFFLLAAFAGSGSALWGSGGLSLPLWIMMLVGFGLKAGIFPLHVWLPVAHPAAPSHVSAMMSGVMIKMGIYGIIRATLALSPELLYTAGMTIFIIGVVTGLFGIIKATLQRDLKRMLAYSSIENIGIIMLALGLGVMGVATSNSLLTLCGIGGALLHVMNHACYKTMLFMGAGSVLSATHKTDMNRLGGLLKRMPLTGWLFLSASLAICAIPPLSGFFSEFAIYSGMLGSIAAGESVVTSIVGVVALALIGGASIFAFSKVFGIVFLGTARSCSARDAVEVDGAMIAAFALPLVGILSGGLLYPNLILDSVNLLGVDSTMTADLISNMESVEWASLVMVGIAVGLWLLRSYLQRGRAISSAPTWGCAFTAPDKQMQYTSSSMSRELEQTVDTVSTSSERLEAMDLFPSAHAFETVQDDKTNRMVTKVSSKILRRWTARLALFQTGKTNHYILHALLFLALILILSLTDLL